ncbi:MAG: DUF3515 family protein [Sporichthyaceae bacterium]
MAAGSVAAIAGCGGPGTLAVSAVPSPAPAVAAVCARLVAALPEKVDDLNRRSVSPPANVAAWGTDVVVVLRCGVGQPKALTQTSQLTSVNEVDWFPEERPDALVFTTVGRGANVELTIPRAHDPQIGPVVDVAAAMQRANPSLPTG